MDQDSQTLRMLGIAITVGAALLGLTVQQNFGMFLVFCVGVGILWLSNDRRNERRPQPLYSKEPPQERPTPQCPVHDPLGGDGRVHLVGDEHPHGAHWPAYCGERPSSDDGWVEWDGAEPQPDRCSTFDSAAVTSGGRRWSMTTGSKPPPGPDEDLDE